MFLFFCYSQEKYEIPLGIDGQWKTAHAGKEGFNIDKVKAFSEQINTKYKKVHSLLVVKNQKLVFEKYYEGYTMEKVHDIASITKSVTSALIGIAIDKKYIKNDSLPVWKFYKNSSYENQWDSLKKKIRIKDLLTMRHGLDCDDFNNPPEDFESFLRSKDYVEHMLHLKMKNLVDKTNAYCTGSTQLLEPVLRTSAGVSVEDFANKYIFNPIGINSFVWGKTPKGNPTLGMGAKMTPRDMAKFGQLYLNFGKWNGNQIISESWLMQSLKPHGKLFEYIDYGYLWYLEPPVNVNGKQIKYFDAAGHGGQTIAVYPELDMVVVITAGNYDNAYNYYEMLEKYLLPAVNMN